MRTTINALVGRRGGACDDDALDTLLDDMRKLLADTRALLELELEQLKDHEFDPSDDKRTKSLKDFVAQLQRLLGQILDAQAKAAAHAVEARASLDLEAARAEILGRLARLVV